MRFLLLNQCFYPDVVSTAQHLTDLARELAARGHEVTVLTSDRGYDDPRHRFPKHELWNNIEIIRIPSVSLGKTSKLRRAINFGTFLINCVCRLLTLRGFDVVVALTSPPLISFIASLFVLIKGGRFCFWVMDLNPDEAIAAGWLRGDSITAFVLKKMLKFSLSHAYLTIVLDRYMQQLVLEKGVDPERVRIVPPWSHDDDVAYCPDGRRDFRAAHGLTEKFVVMYSGNHSPCHPLDTLMNAALILATDSRFAFCFVGGGSEQTRVSNFAKKHRLENIICLPYQPIDQLAGSLSAADLHAVVMGNEFVGIVHPCKIYNILKVGAPVLYVGPTPSHITDIAQTNPRGQIFSVGHGDVDEVIAHILQLGRNKKPPLFSSTEYQKKTVLPRMIALLESSDPVDVDQTELSSSERVPNTTKNNPAQEVVL